MPEFTEHLNLREQTERVCMAFLQTDIDLAFTFLRLADAESKIGRSGRASGLFEKATLAYKSVMAHLDNTSIEFAEEKCELRERAGKLYDAIVTAEHQRQLLRVPAVLVLPGSRDASNLHRYAGTGKFSSLFPPPCLIVEVAEDLRRGSDPPSANQRVGALFYVPDKTSPL